MILYRTIRQGAQQENIVYFQGVSRRGGPLANALISKAFFTMAATRWS